MKNSRKIYKFIRAHIGDTQKAYLSKAVFAFSNKPFVYKKNKKENNNFPDDFEGGLCISADFEMAWAFRYSKRKVNPLKMANKERENIPVLLKLFAKYNMPITWATVGHLMLESCNKGDHNWMHRIPYFDDHWRFSSGDWFDDDPYSNYQKDSAWYAPDLMELILKSDVKHEIGCHTFSHIDCSYKNCPPQVLDDELTAWKKAASKWGVELNSFVFPGGTAGNYEILKKHNVKIYRRNMNFDLAYPIIDQYGLLFSPSTSSFGKSYNWSADYYIYRYKKMIDKAIKTKTIAHIWFHPSIDSWTISEVMLPVLKYAADLREAGKLWIGTMNSMANLMGN